MSWLHYSFILVLIEYIFLCNRRRRASTPNPKIPATIAPQEHPGQQRSLGGGVLTMALLGSRQQQQTRSSASYQDNMSGLAPAQHSAILAAAAAAAAAQQNQQVFYPVQQQQQQPAQEVQPDRPIGYGAFGVVW